jgi:hypothetical protein
MVGATEENGSTANSMAKEPMLRVLGRRSTGSGKMEKEFDG